MIGTTLAHYRVTASLGKGGMGEVWRAEDTRLGREVALKVLPAEMALDPQRIERFEREARAVAALNHPSIVTIHSVEEADGVRFLTMELIDGPTLDRLIPGGGMDFGRFLDLATPIAEALASAHEKGVIHRDLKPSNVMVDANDRVKVLDFGLAKLQESAGSADQEELPTEALTGVGTLVGTVPYMSPEQVEGKIIDHRTDIFSLGVLLYEMATGERPFQGSSSPGLMSSILKDVPTPLTELRSDLPRHLGRVIGRCLEKNRRDRYQTARDVFNELKALRRESAPSVGGSPSVRTASGSGSTSIDRSKPSSDLSAAVRSSTAAGSVRHDEGFWVAVLPFQCRAADPSVDALADGLTEDIVTGLSRFSYLRVISRSSTSRFAGQTVDVRTVGEQLGARYVMEGSIRQAGSVLRVAVQLVDTNSGAHLWAETYNRPFRPEEIFELQDDVAPRIVSTIADMNGVLPHTMSESIRSRPADRLTPYEAMLRGFGYYVRLTAEDHIEARDCLEKAVAEDPGNADCWALLSVMYAEEHKHGFNAEPDPLDRSLAAARKAVAIAPSNHFAHHSLAQALFFRRELPAFRVAAERAVALNPMDGCTTAFMGILMAYAGQWDEGCALAERALELNPHHPGWYRFSIFLNAYRKQDYSGALEVALKINMPTYYFTHASLAAVYGQLGDRQAARQAVRELLAQKPDFGATARDEWGRWVGPGELLEQLVDGLRKAGLNVNTADGDTTKSRRKDEPTVAEAPGSVAIAVLPFSDMSPDKDQDYFCEGMAEEIMNALVQVDGISVASRTSTFRAVHQGQDLPSIGRALSVGHVLEGSVRMAGSRLRVTAQLTEVESGFQLWSERYDRDAADVFAIQDEIAAGVVDAVTSRFDSGVRTVRARPQVYNLEAYQHYLKGRHYRYSKNDHANALKSYEQALALDPSHGPSWVGKAEVTVLAAVYSLIPSLEAYATAKEAIETARHLQGESAEGCYVEGMIALCEARWQDSEASLRRAIELEPGFVPGHAWYGFFHSVHRRLDEAKGHFRRARELDPLAAYPYAMTACGLLANGRHDEACSYAEQSFQFDSENTLALWCLGMGQVAIGQLEKGLAAFEKAVEHSRRGGYILGVLGWGLAAAGRREEAQAILDELRTRAEPAPAVVAEAWARAALGDIEGAWHILQQAEEECQGILCFAGMPPFDPLRADPRFAALLERLGLPPSSRPPGTVAVPASEGVTGERGDSSASRRAVQAGLDTSGSGAEPAGSRGSAIATNTHPDTGNLPASVDSFVAREKELAEVATLLRDTRLVTLVGAGGTGKTRLALETAERLSEDFSAGAWLVELAPVTKAEAVPHVVADLVGAVQQPGKTITESVVGVLRNRSLLLVLDNCEHLLDAAAELADAISTRCPDVRILATSRENLAIRGEQVIRLQSLSDEGGAVLFRDRARAAGAQGDLDVAVLTRLSRRLDGLPLAIELAAARCGALSPEEIERRLDDRFRLLRGSRRGRIEHHQTLRDTVAWSYELLEPLERRVFDRLSVFSGGFMLDAAQFVAGGGEVDPIDVEDAIASLVARSMVLAEKTEDGTRYRQLETLRQFGEERLVASGDAARIRERHVRFFSDFMTRAWSGLWSADDPPWIRAVGREYENLRVAVYAAIDNQDRDALAALLRPHIWWAWHALRYEVGDWAEAALSVEPEPHSARSVAIHLHLHGGRPDDAVRLARGFKDQVNETDPDEECLWAWAHFNASIITESPDAPLLMRRWIEAGHRAGNAARAAAIASIEVAFRMMADETDEARRVAEECHERARSTGNQTALCWTTFFMGRAHSDSDPQEALRHFDRSTEIAKRHHIPLIGGIAATEAAVVIARTEDPDLAWPRLASALRAFVDSGDRRQLWTSAHHLAYFLVRAGRLDDARRLWSELGSRQAYAAQHHRDELDALLGSPGNSVLSDEELVEHIRGLLVVPSGRVS